MPLPPDALLVRYAADPKCYTDCFVRDVPEDVQLADFVAAFYKTWLFRAERIVLQVLVRKPSTDAQADEVASGAREDFAAWTVEDRRGDQLLMCDMGEHTRSWLMVIPHEGGTRLYFGSAVTDKDSMVMRVLLPLHRVYAKALLGAVRL